VTSLFDTAVVRALHARLARQKKGEGRLTQYLGRTAVKSRQKDDWACVREAGPRRPTRLDDVLHLIPLRARLLEDLRRDRSRQWVRGVRVSGRARGCLRRRLILRAY